MTDSTADKALETELVAFVLSFATQMNKIEADIHQKDENTPGDYFEEYQQQYSPIFERHCTDKKRAYGGKAESYGVPTKYDGIENYVEQSFEMKSKNRVEIYFKTDNAFQAEYLFVLLRKNNEWRIDNAKYRWFEKGKLKPLIM